MFTDGQPARAAQHAPEHARREQGRGPIEHVHHAQEGAGHRGIVHRRAIDLGLLSLDQAHRQRARDEAETTCHLAELGWGQDDASFRLFFTTRFIPGGTPEQHQWFNEMERLSTSPENAAAFMREFNTIDVTGLLAQVQCPTLVLHCKNDVRVPFEEGRLMATGIPGAQFVPIDSGNHLLLETEPGWPQWLAAVDAFLPLDAARSLPLISGLSSRQREVLDLLARGRDNSQIAAALGLSEKTVRNQVSAIFDRLGVETRAQAIVVAREAGIGLRLPSRE